MHDALVKSAFSIEHLFIVDNVLQSYPPYLLESNKLKNIINWNEFLKEVYVGGKQQNTHNAKKAFDRQMVLGDILQYIFTGRGYCFAVKGQDFFQDYVKILMRIANLLILMEDMSVDIPLRNKVLDKLKKHLDTELFEDANQEEKFNQLRNYNGKIVPNVGRDCEDAFDSILPKRVGGVKEILVYANLIRKNYGYVVPLLQAQRLLGKRKWIVPPDFLLLRSKGEVFGLEVGTGKEHQISSFSNVVSTPTFTVGIGSNWQPQPFRCDKCQKWITYCDKVIEACALNEDANEKYLICSECENYNNGNCSSIVYYGKAHNHANEIKTRRYHYNCVRNDPETIRFLGSCRTPKLIAPIPWLTGLEYITEE